jgi:hypothetical protein
VSPPLRISPECFRHSPDAEPITHGHDDVEMKQDERQEKKFDNFGSVIFVFFLQMAPNWAELEKKRKLRELPWSLCIRA